MNLISSAAITGLKIWWALKAGILLLSCLFVISLWVPSSRVTGHERPGPQFVLKQIQEMQAAVERFKCKYDRFPLLPGSSAQDAELRSEGAFIAALLGRSEMLNPQKLPFYKPHFAKNFVNGLQDLSGGTSDDPDDLSVLDVFGERYYILLDVDGNGSLLHPRWKGTDTPRSLNTSIAIYSSGPDRNPTTWEDNVLSWR